MNSTPARDSVSRTPSLALCALLFFCASPAPLVAATQEIAARPIAPESEKECWVYQERINRGIAALYQERSAAVTTNRWTYSSTPNCHNARSYGPPEWAPYDDKICSLNRERDSEFAGCLDDVRRAKKSITQLNLLRDSARAYGMTAPGTVTDLRASTASGSVGSFESSYQKAYGVTAAVNLAGSILDVFRKDTSQQRRTEAAVELFGSGMDQAFRGNAVASLMTAIAGEVVQGLYIRSMSELQMQLAHFDAMSKPISVGESNLSYENLYQSAMRDLRNQEASAAQVAALFEEKQLTYSGVALSESSHKKSARAASEASEDISLRPSRRSSVQERESMQGLSKALADAIVDRYGGSSGSRGRAASPSSASSSSRPSGGYSGPRETSCTNGENADGSCRHY